MKIIRKNTHHPVTQNIQVTQTDQETTTILTTTIHKMIIYSPKIKILSLVLRDQSWGNAKEMIWVVLQVKEEVQCKNIIKIKIKPINQLMIRINAIFFKQERQDEKSRHAPKIESGKA